MKIARAIFEKINILIFFLCELPLILRVGRKLKKKKKQAGDFCKGITDIERQRAVSLGATFDDGQKYFSSFRNFYWKSR